MPKLAPGPIEISPEGVSVGLRQRSITRSKPIPPGEWAEVPGFTQLQRQLNAATPDTEGDTAVVPQGEGVRLTHRAVAALPDDVCAAIGLPPATRAKLHLAADSIPSSDDFCIKASFRDASSRRVHRVVEGSILRHGPSLERLPGPLFSVWRAAEALREPVADRDERFARISALCSVLNAAFGANYSTDAFLETLDISYASNISIRSQPSHDGFTVEPLLMGLAAQNAVEGEGQEVGEGLALLSDAEHDAFLKQLGEARTKPAIKLGKTGYVYMPKDLRQAVLTVGAMASADKQMREAFLRNPRPALRDALDKIASDTDPEWLFVPTTEYSARVRELGYWTPPVLPWMQTKGQSWIPERCGVKIGSAVVELPIAKAAELAGGSDEDIETWVQDVIPETLDSTGNDDPVAPPTVADVRAALEQVAGLAELPVDEPPKPHALPEPERPPSLKHFLLVGENLDDAEFSSARGVELSDADHRSVAPPGALTSTLKDYQRDGLDWLAGAQTADHRGALLADDMGLGKTLQTLAAIAWRRTNPNFSGCASALVVAPTALVQNWKQEMDTHFQPGTFGEVLTVTGPGLKALRTRKGRDTHSGSSHLDTEALRRAGVVITTYETLRDYHLSFAQVSFGICVFDEIQKLKNPATQVTQAAKTVNARFWIGVTGTPVENRLTDLWSLSDVLWPGLLGTAREFETRYDGSQQEDLDTLKALIAPDPSTGRLPFLVRRMKSDATVSLPPKIIVPKPVPMPQRQADATRAIVQEALRIGADKTSMLSIIQRLRAASLHPIKPSDMGDMSDDVYVSESARLTATIATLDDISARNEKALVFLESLELQSWLAGYLKMRYGLKRRPMIINGSVSGAARHEYVNRFQSGEPGFDVMILSPKAGGVGLTLTAANHVIHLTRWWNPAVEDQATDRVYRIGQERDVTVHIPMAIHPDADLGPSSFDTKLDELLRRKRALSSNLLAPSDADDDSLAVIFDEIVPAQHPNASEALESVASPEGAPPALPVKRETISLASSVAAPVRSPLWPADYLAAQSAERAPGGMLDILDGTRLLRVLYMDPYCAVDAERSATARFFRDHVFARAGVPRDEWQVRYYGTESHQTRGQFSGWPARRVKSDFFDSLFPGTRPQRVDFRDTHAGRERLHDRVIWLQCDDGGGRAATLKVNLPHGVSRWGAPGSHGDVVARSMPCAVWSTL